MRHRHTTTVADVRSGLQRSWMAWLAASQRRQLRRMALWDPAAARRRGLQRCAPCPPVAK